MGCGPFTCTHHPTSQHEIRPIQHQLTPTYIEKYDHFYADIQVQMRELHMLLNNIEVIHDMFSSRTGMLWVEQRPIGYALIALVAAVSAWCQCDFIKIDLRLQTTYPGIVMNTDDLPSEITEIYNMWVRFCMVLDESVDKINEFSEAFPKNVATAKQFTTDLSGANGQAETSNILQANADRLQDALQSLEQIISKITAAIMGTLDAIEHVNKPSSLGQLHKMGAIFAELGVYDPVTILLCHCDVIDRELPLSNLLDVN